MKKIDIENIMNINYRALTLLGMATSIIMEYKSLSDYHDNSDKCDWFMKAIQDVVYLNKPIPPLPDKR